MIIFLSETLLQLIGIGIFVCHCYAVIVFGSSAQILSLFMWMLCDLVHWFDLVLWSLWILCYNFVVMKLFWIIIGFHWHSRWWNGEKIGNPRTAKGVGSMDFIHTLLIMEDDLDVHLDYNELDISPRTTAETTTQTIATETTTATGDPDPSPSNPLVDWCRCGLCRPMPQAVENKCCQQSKCITTTSRFTKLCLDTDVLELCIRNTSDIRNDREDNSTRAFRKSAYRQFILARHGYLGKANRRVCPACVVLRIREWYPSVTGVYMGYRDH